MSLEKEAKDNILTLRAGNALLEIIPEVGGSITRYCLVTEEQTLNFLRPAIQSGFAKHDPREMASFPLIPFSNRIRNGHFKFQGREIKLPLNFYPEVHSIHGHGWKVPWTVTEKSENKATIEYQFLPDEWPFSYLARQVFDLEASSLTVTLQINNTGNSAMPVGMGLHPYFVRTPQASITAKTEKMWINDAETMPLRLESVPETKLLNQGLSVTQNALDNLFTGWNREVLISWPEWNANLRIIADAPLDFMVIYTPTNADFFCVEPVSNVTDAFNMLARGEFGHGTKTLLPRELLEGKICFVPELS